jgi:hypothetical protein
VILARRKVVSACINHRYGSLVQNSGSFTAICFTAGGISAVEDCKDNLRNIALVASFSLWEAARAASAAAASASMVQAGCVISQTRGHQCRNERGPNIKAVMRVLLYISNT